MVGMVPKALAVSCGIDRRFIGAAEMEALGPRGILHIDSVSLGLAGSARYFAGAIY